MRLRNFRVRTALLLPSVVVLASLLAPATILAAGYTWTGTTSDAWNLASNWGGSGFPNNNSPSNDYLDQATIPYLSARPTVALSTTALLGGATTALSISNKTTGATVNALDITSSGLLGMRGNISIGTRRTITLEGVLRNDGTSGTPYTVSGGSLLMNGGTVSSQNGGVWNFTTPVTGYGVISAPVTTNNTINANIANQTLHITGDVTTNSQRGLGGGSTNHASGALLSFEGGVITAGAGINYGIDNYNDVDLRGTFNGIYLYRDGSGAYNLRGNSTWNDGALNTMNFNGHTLNVGGSITNYGNVQVDTGTLNNPGASAATIANGNFVYLTGGQITSTGGGNITFATNIRGTGTISAPVTIAPNGGLVASGGTLYVTGPLSTTGASSGPGIGTAGAVGDVLDISNTFTLGFTVTLSPGTNGVINLNGTNMTYTPATGGITLGPGAINVTNNSSISGPITSNANLTVNANKTLNASGATFTNNAGAVVRVNNGANAVWGNFTNNGAYLSDPSTQTFNNLTEGPTGYIQAAAGDIYKIQGNFVNNSTQNSLWSTISAELDVISGTSSNHLFALAGADVGAIPGGYTDNFAWGTLDLDSQTLNLTDGNATTGGALYVVKIIGVDINGNLVTNISSSDGLNIYYDASQNDYLRGLTYNLEGGGELIPVGESSSVTPEPAAAVVWLLLGAVSWLGVRLSRRHRHKAGK
jgi:hypothetical protein